MNIHENFSNHFFGDKWARVDGVVGASCDICLFNGTFNRFPMLPSCDKSHKQSFD